MDVHHRFCRFLFICVWSVEILRSSDGSSITWYEPPPVETVTNNNVMTAVNKSITKGAINEELTWNFSVTADLNPVFSVILSSGSSQVATIAPPSTALLTSGFEKRFNVSWVSNKATLIILNVTDADNGEFTCAVTTFGGGSKTWSRIIKVNVEVPTSIITDISRNMTKNDGDEVALTCKANGNPEPKITWTRPPSNMAVPIPFSITGKQDEGAYRCTANNSIGSIDSRGRDVFISVVNYRPFGTNFTANLVNNVATLSETFDLTCSADASPAANYRLYREQESLINTTVGNSSVTHLTTANKRKRQMILRCTPFNEYGDGPTKIITVTVHYSPFVTKNSQTIKTTSGHSTTLLCPVGGFPAPNITWHEGNDTSGEERFNGKNWTFQTQSSDAGWYICFAKNDLGNVSARFRLIVEEKPKSTTPPTTQAKGKKHSGELLVEKINRDKAVYTEEYNDLNNAVTKRLTDPFTKKMDETFANEPHYEKTEVTKLSDRNGSVIVSFDLFFTTPVTANEAFTKLRSVIVNGTFGPFQVGALTVVPTPTTSPTKPGSGKIMDDMLFSLLRPANKR